MNEAKQERITILECTLRDGSYAVDYQFTPFDAAIIASALEAAGVEFIEIGHGLGLKASSDRYGLAAARDEEYLEIVIAAVQKANIGMFCIPGIASLDDLDMAAKRGMKFVRIGTNVTEAELAQPFIQHAKELGLIVSSNLMKSYAVSLQDFIHQVRKVLSCGVSIISIVDSAGGMLPHDVARYVEALRQETDVPIGFHGHNNLQLAVANSLAAVQAGATVIDTTLQGIGRSVGNTQTEVFLLLLKRMGYETGIDVYATMELGDKMIRSFTGSEKGIDSVSAIMGAAQFHSSFLYIINTLSKKYDVDPRELIVKVSEIDRVHVTLQAAEKIAQILPKKKQRTVLFSTAREDRSFFFVRDQMQKSLSERALGIAQEIYSIAHKMNKQSVFTIGGARNPKQLEVSFPFIRMHGSYVIGNAEVVTIDQALTVASAIDGCIDYILVDVDSSDGPYRDMSNQVRQHITKSTVLTYNDTDALVSALDAFIAALLQSNSGRNILIVGNNWTGKKLALRLQERSYFVTTITGDEERLPRQFDTIVGVTHFEQTVTEKILESLTDRGIVIDGGPGSLDKPTIEVCHARGISMYRIDMRAGLIGEIVTAITTHDLILSIIGRRVRGGYSVISGGIIGARGDIIVDSITNPTRVVGVADGSGHLIPQPALDEFRDALSSVSEAIVKERLSL